jgi:hypothetical protein
MVVPFLSAFASAEVGASSLLPQRPQRTQREKETAKKDFTTESTENTERGRDKAKRRDTRNKSFDFYLYLFFLCALRVLCGAPVFSLSFSLFLLSLRSLRSLR